MGFCKKKNIHIYNFVNYNNQLPADIWNIDEQGNTENRAKQNENCQRILM